MTRVKEESIQNAKIRSIFYDIPDVKHMIAAGQLDFVGKAIRGPHDRPSRCMITACCNHQQRVGRPQTNTKNTMVWNLQLLFARVSTTTIDRYDSLKAWINEASDEKYWTALVQCLLHSNAPLPEQPPAWGAPPRRSTVSPCRLLRPSWTGITMTQMLGSPQHHHGNAPPLGNPNSHSLPCNPPKRHLFLIQKQWLNDPILANKMG
jgi:hypothetical protein